ncbi:hypothetical protein FB451DRAFT_1486601 [Mycena latifolia]|nr:hypothetical protein FB451DRAFT_1486601 [Mycena latifolia]
MPSEAEIEALLTGVPLARMQTTYNFDQRDILNSFVRAAHDHSVQYITSTDRRRQRTTLAGKSGSDAVIDWEGASFEIAGCRRAIGALKRRTSSLSSSRYWTFSLLEEFKVRYDDGAWTVATSNGAQIASMSSHVARVFRDSTPAVLRFSPELRDEDERRFIILVLLYSETRRLDVTAS